MNDSSLTAVSLRSDNKTKLFSINNFGLYILLAHEKHCNFQMERYLKKALLIYLFSINYKEHNITDASYNSPCKKKKVFI